MRCAICSESVAETFLKKPLGTTIKDAKGKPHIICFACQKRFLTKEEQLAKMA